MNWRNIVIMLCCIVVQVLHGNACAQNACISDDMICFSVLLFDAESMSRLGVNPSADSIFKAWEMGHAKTFWQGCVNSSQACQVYDTRRVLVPCGTTSADRPNETNYTYGVVGVGVRVKPTGDNMVSVDFEMSELSSYNVWARSLEDSTISPRPTRPEAKIAAKIRRGPGDVVVGSDATALQDGSRIFLVATGFSHGVLK